MDPFTLASLLVALAALGGAVAASLHAILYKRDVRAAIGWAGFIWIAPVVGPLFYLLFGVNRIRRKAVRRRGPPKVRSVRPRAASSAEPHVAAFVRYGDAVGRFSLHPGNCASLLDAAAAGDAILERIGEASRSVALSTYIFEDDAAGRRVVDALIRARQRGVEVRVLIDAVGSRNGGRAVMEALGQAGIASALFLPTRAPRGILSANLRNHRKLVIVDAASAFTGGMNITEEYRLDPADERAIRDTHFCFEGPVVADLMRTFLEDWHFATGERLPPDVWCASPGPRGDEDARVVPDGPDEDFERTRWTILGAIATARRTVRIATPYFLPDGALVTALNVAALRGVAVEIFIPERLDHRFVKWASNALLWQVLEKGCRVWFTPPPFDHSKLFTVDGAWSLVGSSNWDPRSLRLNFELNVEVFGERLAASIDRALDARREAGREITLAMVDARPFAIRVRDGLARLLTPYL